MTLRRSMQLLAVCALIVSSSCSKAGDAEDLLSNVPTGPVEVVPSDGPNPLAGMRGTTPGVDISTAFRNQVLDEDSTLTTLSGAAEGYDAMTILAIAADAARSDGAGRVANEIVELTARGSTCTAYYQCRLLVEKHREIDYEGKSGGIQMLPNGDPGEGTFGVVEFDGVGAIVSIDTTTARSDELDSLPEVPDLLAGPKPDGVLKVGMLLPSLGPSGDRASAAQAGIRAAIKEINQYGGPLGEPVVLVDDNTEDGSPEAISRAVDALIEAGVDAVIGGTTAEIDSLALGPLSKAGIVLISPTDASREMSVAADAGMFFRLAPPASLEGKALGRLVANDGHVEVGLISGPRASDLDFANDLESELVASDSKVSKVLAAEPTGSLDATLDTFVSSGMSAVVISGDPGYAARVIAGLIRSGSGPRDFAIYGTSEIMVPRLNELVGDE